MSDRRTDRKALKIGGGKERQRSSPYRARLNGFFCEREEKANHKNR